MTAVEQALAKLDAKTTDEWRALAESQSIFDQAFFELWRGRAAVASVTAARLSREKADALLAELVRLGGEVERLTRERDKWQATAETLTDRETMADLFTAERERAEAAEAQVERLSRERDEARNALDAREIWQERFRAAEAVAASYRQALEEARTPLYDERFRSRLLRHALSNEEVRDLVDAIESTQAKVDAALASSAEAGTPKREAAKP